MSLDQDKIQAATSRLAIEQIDYDVRNNGVHLIVTDFQGDIIDFWPTTGNWNTRNRGSSSGLNNLIRYIKDKWCVSYVILIENL